MVQSSHKVNKTDVIALNQETTQTQTQRRNTMNTELIILERLTDILEKEKLLSVEERNHAINLLKRGGNF